MTPPAPRLLVISYHFPSDGAVGGLRWAGFGKYLVRMGWQVQVVTAAPGSSRIAGMSVERRAPGPTTLGSLARLRRGLTQSTHDSPTLSPPREADRPGPLARLRREVVALLSLPDQGRGWILRAVARSRAVIRTFRPDVIVSSGPPHAAHLVARLARIGAPARWYADLRDPWAALTADTVPWDRVRRTWIARHVVPGLERLALGTANGVIVSTPELGEVLAHRYPAVGIRCVRGGFDREALPTPVSGPVDGLEIAYVGSLYGKRDIGPVLRAMRCFLDRRGEDVDPPIKLRIAGMVDDAHRAAVAHAVEALNLDTHVELLGVLSRMEALRLVSRSHLAVVLAQVQPAQVPVKLYESAAMQVPTVVITDRASAAARAARELGAVVVEPRDANGLVHLLERIEIGDGPVPRMPPDYATLAAELSHVLYPAADFGDTVGPDGRRPGALPPHVGHERAEGSESLSM